MGRTVLDVALLLEVQAGYDARLPLSLHGSERFAQSLHDFDARQVRVGWLGDMSGYLYATFAGLPCISVPVGFSPTGLPMGMQLIGRPRSDLAVLQLAHAYEQAVQDVVRVRPQA